MKRIDNEKLCLVSEVSMLNSIKSYYRDLQKMYQTAISRFSQISSFTQYRLKMQQNKYNCHYLCKAPGEEKYTYLGTRSSKTVIRIHEAYYYRSYLEAIRNNLKLIEGFLEKFESVSFQNIMVKLPKAYRNETAFKARSTNSKKKRWKEEAEAFKASKPIIREHELIHPTIDGNLVRSKAEALIYNHLYENGYTFVYELPLEADGKLFYPDFSILSEIDYVTVIRIEHHGAMGDPGYRDHSEEREANYWMAGYLPNRDVYFTYDDNKGVLDIEPIKDILKLRVRP